MNQHRPLIPQPLIPRPLIPQPLIPQPLIPQPLVPQPLIPQPLIPQPLVNQPLIPQPLIPQPLIVQNTDILANSSFDNLTAEQKYENLNKGSTDLFNTRTQETEDRTIPQFPTFIFSGSPF
ncbi:26937_t:CDS:1 [Gigaspora margarita]|uniref:26937_t:CDS:1 n=1 Tax=Gigaspora margarita TaxID=4874 RepID=A0ABN7W701_GIGMA|nr:26937_t:CDS:1 [Gigaspora margarita]